MSLTPVFFAVSLLLLINTRSHKSWVSGVQWSPTDPFVLATTSHDGTLKVLTQNRNLLLSLSKPLLTINVYQLIENIKFDQNRYGIFGPLFHCILSRLWTRRAKRDYAWHLEMGLFIVGVAIVWWSNLRVRFRFSQVKICTRSIEISH